jgi:hypothetical protein
MKLIIQHGRIAGTATDAYAGPDAFIAAPVDFDMARMGEYVVADGAASLPLPGVPQQVTMRQACIQLEIDGLLDDVEAVVATLPKVYQIEWQRAAVVYRDNALVEMVRQQRGMTPEQIDDLFTKAAAL